MAGPPWDVRSRTPRYTAVWKSEIEHLSRAVQAALDNSLIRAHWCRLAELRAARCGHRIEWTATVGLRHKLEPEIVLGDLICLVRLFVPALDFQLGPHLGHFLIDGADHFAQAGGEGAEWRLWRFHGNPITVDADGDPHGYGRALPTQRHQFDAYLRSIDPVDVGGAPARFQNPEAVIAAVLETCQRFGWTGDQAPTLEKVAGAMYFASGRGLQKLLERSGLSWARDVLPRLRG